MKSLIIVKILLLIALSVFYGYTLIHVFVYSGITNKTFKIVEAIMFSVIYAIAFFSVFTLKGIK